MLVPAHVEAGMDFDFKDGKRHYRGHGARGLMALVILMIGRVALFGAGALLTYPALSAGAENSPRLLGIIKTMAGIH